MFVQLFDLARNNEIVKVSWLLPFPPPFSPRCRGPGLGVTLKAHFIKFFRKICPILEKYHLEHLNHIHIWQVLPQLSCRNTCQVWMWDSIGNQCFDNSNKIEKMIREKIKLVIPTPVMRWDLSRNFFVMMFVTLSCPPCPVVYPSSVGTPLQYDLTWPWWSWHCAALRVQRGHVVLVVAFSFVDWQWGLAGVRKWNALHERHGFDPAPERFSYKWQTDIYINI